MRHLEFAGLEDVYFFDLSRGEVTLSIGHTPSPMGGHQVRLSSGGSAVRPSDVGVEGLDGLWEDDPYPDVQALCASAYGVSDEAVTRLVAALEQLEGGVATGIA